MSGDKLSKSSGHDPDLSLVVLLPFESYLDIEKLSSRHLTKHAFDSLRIGTIVYAEIRSAHPKSAGFTCNIICTHFPARDLSTCSIRGFLPFKSMSHLTSKTLQRGDYVRSTIASNPANIGTDRDDFPELDLSLLQHSHSDSSPQLGIICNADLPLYYRRLIREKSKQLPLYEISLRESPSFANPSGITNLLGSNSFGGLNDRAWHEQSSNGSYVISSLRKLTIRRSDTALNLRHKQSHLHANECVDMGIQMSKRGEVAAGLQRLHHALDLDATNVMALVSRGALYAASESFEKAIEDFEKALSLEPTNKEAKSYLCECLVATALSHKQERRYESARRALQRATDICPERRNELEKIPMMSPSLERPPSPTDKQQTIVLDNSSRSTSSALNQKANAVVVSSASRSRSPSSHRDKHRRHKTHKKRHHSTRSSDADGGLKEKSNRRLSGPQEPKRHRYETESSAMDGYNNGNRSSLSLFDQTNNGRKEIPIAVQGTSGGETLEDMEQFMGQLKERRRLTSASASQ